MVKRTLLGTLLGMAFSIASYAVYVMAIVEKEQVYLLISVFLFFFPTVITITEDLESSRKSKGDLIFSVVFLLLSAILLTVLLVFLFNDKPLSDCALLWVKIISIVIPAFFLPAKVWPFMLTLFQCFNKQIGKR